MSGSNPHPTGPLGRLFRLLRHVGECINGILLTLIYIILWLPVGVLTRLLVDWLQYKQPAQTAWCARPERLNDPGHLKEPY